MIHGSPAQRRLINGILAGVLAAFGLGMSGYAIVLATDPVMVEDHRADYRDGLLDRCVSQARRSTGDAFFFEASRHHSGVEVYGEMEYADASGLDDHADPFGLIMASVKIIERCEGLELDHYCMGVGCNEPDALVFEMSLIGEER